MRRFIGETMYPRRSSAVGIYKTIRFMADEANCPNGWRVNSVAKKTKVRSLPL